MRTFEKLTKKYALNNSYFKNRLPDAPATPIEVWQYFQQHGELPYENGNINRNWFYDCFVEYQKRAGVKNSQFFTPTKTAIEIADTVHDYTVSDNDAILDACCGFGQITRELVNMGLTEIKAFDIDKELVDICYRMCDEKVQTYTEDFLNEENTKGVRGQKYDIIVSNPPYEIKDLTEFLYFANEILYQGGKLVLLIPIGFLDKTRPARLVQVLNNFAIIERKPMNEDFARTKAKAEIAVLEKL